MAENLTSSPNNGNTFVSGIPKRIIKFRATKDDMSDPKWLYGTLHIREDSFGTIHTIEYRTGDYFYEQSSVIAKTVGQFVGLMDMLTKDAYEGDIIERDASDGKGKVKGVIVFEEGQFRVNWLDKNKGWNNSLYLHLEDSKIVGNVHDNPELLG